MGKNFIPQNVTPEALTPIRDTAARMAAGTPEQQGIVQAATSSKTPPLQRLGAYQSVVQNALSDLESQHAPALAQAANTPVDTASLVKTLQSQISPTMDSADVSAINKLIQRTQQAKTIGDLNTFRQELNKSTSSVYRQTSTQAGNAPLGAQAEDDLAGDVRTAYYDNLQKATGIDFTPLKIQESNLIRTQEALQNQQSPLAKAEATFKAPTTFRESAGNVANVIASPKTTVTQTILRESPATRISILLQKSLSDLPEPTPVPSFTPRAALPAPAQAQLPAQVGGAYQMPGKVPYSPGMSAGERSAALNHWLRQRQQMALPAQAQPIPLPPPQ
jgi:hypothetical protein